MQAEAASSILGDEEGAFPPTWAPFFKHMQTLQDNQQYEAVALASLRTLKAVVWAAESMASKSANHKHCPAYADVTMFVRNFGPYVAGKAGVARTQQELQHKSEVIADRMLDNPALMKCFRCGKAGTHLDSMCFVSGAKKPVRARSRMERSPEDERDRGRDNKRGFGGFRGKSANERSFYRR